MTHLIFVIMASTLNLKLRFFPTARQWEAIKDLCQEQQQSGAYKGKWLIADTVRYLISIPYVENSYPIKIKKLPIKTVNVSQSMLDALSPPLDGENGCAYVYRLLTSGLIQEGYLKVDESDVSDRNTPIDNNLTRIRNKKSARKCDSAKDPQLA